MLIVTAIIVERRNRSSSVYLAKKGKEKVGVYLKILHLNLDLLTI